MAGKVTDRSPISALISAQKRGECRGLTSVCSANPWVIEATLNQSVSTGEPVLIESTCNQVNQFGGYTGWTPLQFVAYVRALAARQGFPFERVMIGGDHLGPSPWQNEPSAVAMEKARNLVHYCVQAGYVKVHLDASMKCADDDPDRPVDPELAAARAAELALTAEQAVKQQAPTGLAPYYVIGTEVPLPGGVQEHEERLAVTAVDDVAHTIEVTKAAFLERGLAEAWERVIAVVVQPGVEYGNDVLFEYDPVAAASLAQYIEGHGGLVYEAHSTDYQSAQALRRLVADHFAILKVGPALTFALREGIYALAQAEEELLIRTGHPALSRIRERLDDAMVANPVYWRKYYHGDDSARSFARKFSFSDRSRYYWAVQEVQQALSQLLRNIEMHPLPLPLLSQYFPVQYGRVRSGKIANEPRALLLDRVQIVLSDYSYACGYLPNPGDWG